ncbi:MAG: hypothetical protein WCO60_02535 [Verrucomicrobiota bacterium]
MTKKRTMAPKRPRKPKPKLTVKELKKAAGPIEEDRGRPLKMSAAGSATHYLAVKAVTDFFEKGSPKARIVESVTEGNGGAQFAEIPLDLLVQTAATLRVSYESAQATVEAAAELVSECQSLLRWSKKAKEVEEELQHPVEFNDAIREITGNKNPARAKALYEYFLSTQYGIQSYFCKEIEDEAEWIKKRVQDLQEVGFPRSLVETEKTSYASEASKKLMKANWE